MIKIQKNSEVEKIFLDDMQKSDAGLIKTLAKSDVKLLLSSRYADLYALFYDINGNVDEVFVKKILLADRGALEGYIALLGKYDENPEFDTEELLKKVFRYKPFSNRKSAYEILKKMDVRVCPYCNRTYTFTLVKEKIRPQFDHFYPKSIYPYLALSLYNLIPSCGICNGSKSNIDTIQEPILYPYEEEFGEDARFVIREREAKVLQGVSDNFDILLDTDINPLVSSGLKRKIEKQNIVLHLQKLYEEHKDYVKDILRNHYINTPERVSELMKQFPDLFSSKEDVMQSIYMVDCRKESWGKRPLTKLVADIIYDIERK